MFINYKRRTQEQAGGCCCCSAAAAADLCFSLLSLLLKVRLAQKSIPTGLVYKQNEEVLEEVGAAELQKMLERRDWSGLEGKKVIFVHKGWWVGVYR